MSAGAQIDYDALAQKHGAVIDYDSLASQHGGASDSADSGPSTYDRLTRGYNPDVEEYARNHPVLGPVVRFLDSAGGAAISTPEGLYNMLRHPGDSASGLIDSIKAWGDPAVRQGALSVLPEALGQGVGNAAGGELVGAGGTAARELAPSAETVGKVLRDPATGKLKALPREAARMAAIAAGHAILPGEGGIAGAFVGPRIADALVPKIEPNVAKAVPIRQSPSFDTAAYNAGRKGVSLQEMAAQQAAKEGTGVNVVPEPRGNFTGEVPGYMASVPRGTLEDLALAGKPGAAVQLQQLGKPIIYSSRGGDISNVKSSVKLSDLAPGKPEWAYRVRDVGEEGVPANATERRAHATTSLEDAQGIMQDRGSVTGKEQETVRYDLSKLKEGVDYLRHPREGQPDWIQMLRPVPESAIRRVPAR